MKRDQYRDWASLGENTRSELPGNFQPQQIDVSIADNTDMDPTVFWRIGKIGKIGSSKLRLDDDFADRLNYQFTSVLIFILISITGVRQYFGKPIQCWIPQEFTRGWEEYAESYCWVSYTYFSPVNKRLPRTSKKEIKISYYQWAAIMLGIQALLFCIPCLIWRALIVQSGFNLRRIIQVANDSNALVPEHLNKCIKFIASHMDKSLKRKKIYGTGWKAKFKRLLMCLRGGCCGRQSGNYLTFAYLFVKLLYMLNIFGQLYLMQKFIDTSYMFYGAQVLYDLIKGREWTSSGHFPRVTFCDFEAKKLGKNHIYTLQCVLPLNMFLEKIFIFLWFWHLLVGCITIFSFACWASRMFVRKNRIHFIKEYLELLEKLEKSEYTWSRSFILDYLRLDGIFIVHLISTNVGDIVAGDVVCELWNLYKNQKYQYYDSNKRNEDSELPQYRFINVKKDIPVGEFEKADNNDDIV